jgi:two-component system, LytTR family, response regulator
MQVMNCLIVEDESLASDIIKDYIQQVPGLKLSGICRDVFSAMEKLHDEHIDIIFLDINLPKINGMDFIKTISGRYDIILTTAYHQYALEGFNLNVVDYLLKPVEFSRFLQAVNKVFEKNKQFPPSADHVQERKYFFFNVDKKQVKVFADEILYIESLKDYVRIHTKDKKLVTKFQIGELDRLLNENKFIRIHKSYIVNSDKISAYNANEIEMETTKLPIGRTYKELVEKHLKSFNRNSF